MSVLRKTFRVFVSSTFKDMQEERNALQKDVFPKLEEFAARRGCRFQAIDLRWGISEEASYDQKTLDICLNEIKRCQEISPRLNFIVLLGERYGSVPLPTKIPADEFEAILSCVDIPMQKKLLLKWYRKDDNAIPPEYVIQPRIGKYKNDTWKDEVEKPLLGIFQNAVKKLNLSEETRLKYEASVTHQEINQGVFKVKDAGENVFCFFRTIENLPEGKNSEGFTELCQYIERYPVSRAKLDQLKTKLKNHLQENQFKNYKVQWQGSGITSNHIEQLCNDVSDRLKRIIATDAAQWKSMDALENEINTHHEFGLEQLMFFVERNKYLNEIIHYIKSDSTQPMILYGEQGIGKTALIAGAIEKTRKEFPKAEVIQRFIGSTPDSMELHSLLDGIIRQIARINGGTEPKKIIDFDELLREFFQQLSTAAKEKQLIIFIDGIDQLSNMDYYKNTTWISGDLPEHVSMIISTLPGENFTALENEIKRKSAGTVRGNFLKINGMTSREGGTLLERQLNDACRTLKEEQKEIVLENFKKCGGNPLYLKIAYEEVRRWHSYTPPEKLELSSNVQGIMNDFINRLSSETNHGKIMVSKSLSYLKSARIGLDEYELLTILSRDEDVMVDFKRRYPGSPQVEKLPIVVWLRLFSDIETEPYIHIRNFQGYYLMAVLHRQFEEVIVKQFLNTNRERLEIHRHLADFFESLGVDDIRTLTELGYQLSEGATNEPFPLKEGDSAFLHDRLYRLMKDDSFRKAQVEKLYSYIQPMFDIERAIRCFIPENMKEIIPEFGAKLCWLALRAGELRQEAKDNIFVAFEWAKEKSLDDPDRIEKGLERFKILNDEEFFKAALLLLWIETERQEELVESKRNDLYAKSIINTILKRIEGRSFDWSKYISSDFMAWMSIHVLEVMPSLDIIKVFFCTSKVAELVESALRQIQDKGKPINSRQIHFLIKLSESITDTYKKSETISTIAYLSYNSGFVETAEDLFTHKVKNLIDDLSKMRVQSETASIFEYFGEVLDFKIPMYKHGQGTHKISTLTTLSGIITKIERLPGKTELFLKIIKATESIDDNDKNWVILAHLLTEIEKNRDITNITLTLLVEKVVPFIDSVEDELHKRNLLFLLARIVVKIEEKNKIDKSLKEIVDSAKTLSSTTIRNNCFLMIAELLASEDLWEKALEILDNWSDAYFFLWFLQNEEEYREKFHKIWQSCSTGDSYNLLKHKDFNTLRFVNLTLISKFLFQQGEFKKASRFLQLASDADKAVNDLYTMMEIDSRIGEILTEWDDLEEARMFFKLAFKEIKSINESNIKVEPIVGVVERLSKAEKLKERRVLIMHIITHLGSIPVIDDKIRVLIKIVETIGKAKNFKDKAILFELILIIIEPLPDGKLKDDLLLTLAAEIGNIDEDTGKRKMPNRILASINTVSEEGKKIEILSSITGSLKNYQVENDSEQKGLLMDILECLDSISDGKGRLTVLSVIAGQLRNIGNIGNQDNFFDRIFDILETTRAENDINADTLLEIVRTILEIDNIVERNKLLDRALTAAAKTTCSWEWPKVIFSIVQLLIIKRDKEKAIEIHMQLILAGSYSTSYRKKNLRDNFLRNMAAVEAMLGEYNRAFLTLEEVLENEYGKFYTAFDILLTFSQNRNCDDKVLKKFRNFMKTITVTEGKTFDLWRIASKFIHSGYYEIVFEMLSIFPSENSAKARTIRDLALGVVKEGNRKVNQIFNRIIGEVDTFQDPELRIEAFSGIVVMLWKANDVKRADQVIKQAIDSVELISDEKKKGEALINIADTLSEIGKISQAAKIAESIEVDTQKYKAQSKIVQRLAKSGQVSQAARLAQSIKLYSDKSDALTYIMQREAQDGKFNEAFELLDQIKRDSKLDKVFGSGNERAKALLSIARGLIQNKESSNKKGIFLRLIECIENMSNKKIKGETLEKFTSLLGNAETLQVGDEIFDRIVHSAKCLEEISYMFSVLAESSIAAAKRGQFTRALQIIDEIDSPTGKNRAIEGTAKVLSENDQMMDTGEVSTIIIKLTGVMAKEEYNAKTLANIAKAIVKHGAFHLFEEHVVTPNPSEDVLREVLKAWRESLLEKVPYNLDHLRRSLKFNPFLLNSSFGGVHALLLAYAKLGNWNNFIKIIRECPQLDLDFLVEDSKL